MKTLCLLPVASDARIQRRLAALRSRGLDLDVLSFDRQYYAGKALPGGYRSLGHISHGNLVKRVPAIARAVPAVRAAAAQADVIYAFGSDLLALAWLATRGVRRRPRIVYEVADIHPVLVGEGFQARAMRAFERHLVRQISLMVVTSKAFITEFYEGIQQVSGLSYELVENKPELGNVVRGDRPVRSPGDPLVIGYFGVIRCERSWTVLTRLAAAAGGRVRVLVRGVPLGIQSFHDDVAACPWIEYGGPYTAPDDLAGMYRSVDAAWIAHRVDDNNSLLWNRLNRFYESCAFQTPMIAQTGTQDAKVVSELGLGVCLDLADVDDAVGRLLSLSRRDLDGPALNVGRLPRRVYAECGEHDHLMSRIRALAHAV